MKRGGERREEGGRKQEPREVNSQVLHESWLLVLRNG